MIKAMYPGSFDPITKGHLDVIVRAAKVYDEVLVAVMDNPLKGCTFSKKERMQMIIDSTRNLSNVRVVSNDGLTVDFAYSMGCRTLIRGIRALADYEYELAQATTNYDLNPNVETQFFVAKPEYSFLSSSIVKQVAAFNGNIEKYVPEECYETIINKLYKERNNKEG